MNRPSKIKLHSAKTGRELKEFVAALAVDCPVGHSNPEDCPLHDLREQKMPARLKWLQALGEDDLQYLAAYHQVCLNTKILNGACLGRRR